MLRMNKKSMLQKFIIALLFAIFTAGTAAAGLFDNAEANRLIDENYEFPSPSII